MYKYNYNPSIGITTYLLTPLMLCALIIYMSRRTNSFHGNFIYTREFSTEWEGIFVLFFGMLEISDMGREPQAHICLAIELPTKLFIYLYLIHIEYGREN